MKSNESIRPARKRPSVRRRRITRGAFLRSVGRCVLLIAAAALTVVLATWRKSDSRGAAGCGIDLPCTQCAELGHCSLARAARTRQAIQRGKS